MGKTRKFKCNQIYLVARGLCIQLITACLFLFNWHFIDSYSQIV